MGDDGKNCWPANYSKPEFWRAQPEKLHTSVLGI